MNTSGHKRLVIASCGCGGVLFVAMGIAVAFGLREASTGPGSEFARDIWYTPSHARAALDSLAALDFAVVNRPTPFVLGNRAGASGNGAVEAVALWRDSIYRRINIALGDTLPEESQRRANWLAAAAWTAVDTLLEAATLPWRLTGGALPGPDSTGRLMRALIDPGPVLWTTRAMLARARRDATRSPRPADTLVLAAITIGRRLQEDVLLPHVLLGLRLERDALEMLMRLRSQAGRDIETLENRQIDREESEMVLRQAARLIRHAGSLPDLAPDLARLADDPDLPLAIRSELVIAIGYGWALSPGEGAVISPLRRKALETLSLRDKSGLGLVVAAARGAVRTGFARRLLLSTDYQALANDVQYGRFSRPR